MKRVLRALFALTVIAIVATVATLGFRILTRPAIVRAGMVEIATVHEEINAPGMVQSLMNLLKKIAKEQSSAVIAVTHDERMIAGFDTVKRLRDGRFD